MKQLQLAVSIYPPDVVRRAIEALPQELRAQIVFEGDRITLIDSETIAGDYPLREVLNEILEAVLVHHLGRRDDEARA